MLEERRGDVTGEDDDEVDEETEAERRSRRPCQLVRAYPTARLASM
jgi:hypothetical protein